MNNIDKELFNERMKQYLNGTYIFSSQLYNDLKAIVYNVTYTHQFSELMTYEDNESELILFTLTKCQYLKNKGNITTNYYNLLFSIMKRKFLDILRANNRIKKGIRTDVDVYQSSFYVSIISKSFGVKYIGDPDNEPRCYNESI